MKNEIQKLNPIFDPPSLCQQFKIISVHSHHFLHDDVIVNYILTQMKNCKTPIIFS